MKKLIAIIFISFSFTTLACTDFSGRFQFPEPAGEGPGITTIVQIGCEAIQMDNIYVLVDNNYHEVLNEEVVIEGEVVGHVVITAKAFFDERKLFLDQTLTLYFLGETQTKHVQTVNALLNNGDFESIQTDVETGETITMIGQRIR